MLSHARIDRLDIAWESFGSPTNPTILLLPSVGGGSNTFSDSFCELLAGSSFRCVRFDCRDSGESSRVTDGSRYGLVDLSDEAFLLLDALGIERAHIVGASIGGMVGQLCAIRRPWRALSLTSIASTTSDADLPLPCARALTALVSRSKSRGHAVGDGLAGGDVDESWRQNAAVRSLLAGVDDLDGAARMIYAAMHAKSRSRSMKFSRVPMLVVHGREDVVLPLAHGLRTARESPASSVRLIADMGHRMDAKHEAFIATEISVHAELEGHEHASIAPEANRTSRFSRPRQSMFTSTRQTLTGGIPPLSVAPHVRPEWK